MNRGFFIDVKGLHQINLHFMHAVTDRTDIFINVLTLRHKSIFVLKALQINPEGLKPLFIDSTNRYLLNT